MRSYIRYFFMGIGAGIMIIIYTVIVDTHPDFAKADTKVEKTDKKKQVCTCKN